MVGFSQTSVDERLKSFIDINKPGSFILFKRNLGSYQETKNFTSAIVATSKESSGIEPLIAVDQEGGIVSRIPLSPALPSAMAMGLADREDWSEALGEETGLVLKSMGFNMNLAPVLDLADPERPSFLGTRSFGANPARVGTVGVAFARGLRKSGVLPTAKHFPGLGSSVEDPHQMAVTRVLEPRVFMQNDLEPFHKYVALGETSAIMVSQMSYPFLDASGLPAPFSKQIMSDLLRTDLGYDGLVITDDLQMKASATVIRPDEAALESLRAGADLIMLTWSFRDQAAAIQRVVTAVEKKEFPLNLLNEKVTRVLKVKAALLKREMDSSSVLKLGERLSTKKLAKIDQQILDLNLSRRLASVPKSVFAKLPQRGEVCLYSPTTSFVRSFQKAIKSPNKSFILSAQHSTAMIEKSFAVEQCRLGVLVVLGQKSARLARTLAGRLKEKFLVINLGLPADLAAESGFLATLQIGFHHQHTGYRVAQFVEAQLKPAPELKPVIDNSKTDDDL